MSLTNDVVASVALVLVAPSVLFVLALLLRQWQPFGAGPARTAERVVQWYAAHPQLALWVLLLILPLVAFVLGSAALLRTWGANAELQDYIWRGLAEIPEHLPAFLIAVATIVSATVLAVIGRHVMRACGVSMVPWR
jgi:hypothetical protein